MVILYSITGVITALFLGIIVTGAVRAHRHPERYGPRRIAGRVRQSRARGIARAMLDTIPVVKFDENNDDVEAAKRNVEMSSEDPAREHSASQGDGITADSSTPESELPTPDENERPTATAPDTRPETVPDAGNFSCPICTDDFIKGQDLRVLPCNHQFHVECIDPWLMNVSGTCPLWYVLLLPYQTTISAYMNQTNHIPAALTSTHLNPKPQSKPTKTPTKHNHPPKAQHPQPRKKPANKLVSKPATRTAVSPTTSTAR
jgi:hypothetical protein